MKREPRTLRVYQTEHRPMYYGCSATILSALAYYAPALADEIAYYAALMHWVFFFDAAEQTPLAIPADQLLHRNLFYLYGITRRQVRRDSFAALWEAIEELLEAGRVVLAWVDADHVDDRAFHYNRLPGHAELMIIYGYDRKAGNVEILVAPQRFQGCIPFSRLPELLVDTFVYDYCLTSEALVGWPADRALPLLEADIQGMRNGGRMGSVKAGLSGVGSFVEVLQERLAQPRESVLPWMKNVFERMTLFGPQRIYLGYALQRLAGLSGASRLAVCAQLFLDLGQGWEVARNLFFKGWRQGGGSILPRIGARLAALYALEREQVDRLEDSLQEIKGLNSGSCG